MSDIKNDRKQIDNFLIELDKFIQKFIEDEDPLGLYNTFIPIFKANIHDMSCMKNKSETIEIPMLTNFINKSSDNNFKLIRRQRTDKFIRRIAYRLKYKEVKDVSYEHIFLKILLHDSTRAKFGLDILNVYANYLSNFDPLSSFLIPEEFFHNDDLIIYNYK